MVNRYNCTHVKSESNDLLLPLQIVEIDHHKKKEKVEIKGFKDIIRKSHW